MGVHEPCANASASQNMLTKVVAKPDFFANMTYPFHFVTRFARADFNSPVHKPLDALGYCVRSNWKKKI
jgi:hypothetical protein